MANLAAIDVGSNGIRFTVASRGSRHTHQRLHTAREPIRLGQDVFKTGRISPTTFSRLLRAFDRFRKFADRHDVTRIQAVATSAMREARNGKSVVQQIRQHTGVAIRIIDGKEEARLIWLAVQSALPATRKPTLLFDIGGGSIALTVTRARKALGMTSLPLGAVRLLRMLPEHRPGPFTLEALVQRQASAVGAYLDEHVGQKQVLPICVGTGGNIESLGKLRMDLLGSEDRNVLLPDELEQIIHRLRRMTVRQRIAELGLRPDRADVILPAALVLRMIVQQSGCEKIVIPRVGVKEGLLIDMAKKR